MPASPAVPAAPRAPSFPAVRPGAAPTPVPPSAAAKPAPRAAPRAEPQAPGVPRARAQVDEFSTLETGDFEIEEHAPRPAGRPPILQLEDVDDDDVLEDVLLTTGDFESVDTKPKRP